MSSKLHKPKKLTKSKKTAFESKKVSENDKSKRKKEDMEKSFKEEEETRLRVEAEEAEQKAREVIMNKEMKKREKDEKDLIVREIPKLNALETHHHVNYLLFRATQHQGLEWNRYLNPEMPPNPFNLRAVNLYLKNLKKENSKSDLTMHLKLSQNLMELVDEMTDCLHDEGLSKMAIYAIIADMENFVLNRMNACTYTYMSDVKAKATADSDYVAYESNDWLSFCIWANITKNPRTRGFEVEEKSLFCEVTPSINRLSCCIRIVFYAFNFYADKNNALLALEDNNDDLARKSALVSASSIARSVFDIKTLKSTFVETIDAKTPRVLPKIIVHETEDLRRNEELAEKIDNSEAEEEEEELNLANYGLETPPSELEIEEKSATYEDSMYVREPKMANVGGVFSIDLFQLPDQPKTVKHWTMQTVVDPPRMFPIEYSSEMKVKAPAKHFSPKRSVAQPKLEPSSHDDSKQASAESVETAAADAVLPTPLMLSFKIPSGVVFFKTPVVGTLETKSGQWQLNQVSDVLYNESNKQISFKIFRFGTMALFQSSSTNMPYREFQLVPCAELNKAKLSIKGIFVSVEFTVQDSLVCLSSVSEDLELDSLLNKYMPLGRLQKKMEFAGLNFFDKEKLSNFVNVEEKSKFSLGRLYSQMGMVAFQAAFKSSRWNNNTNDKHKFLLQMNPSYDPSSHDNEGWSMVEVTLKHASHLKMQEGDENYNYATFANHFHSNLYHLLLKMKPFDPNTRLNEADSVFARTVSSLLQATNPLLLTRVL